MKPGPEADPLYLDNIVDLILLVREGIAGVQEAECLADRTKGDATALRLAAIEEFSRKLSNELKARHKEIAWVKLIRLRNIVAHHHDQLEYRIIWDAAMNHLERLYTACRAELDEIDR